MKLKSILSVLLLSAAAIFPLSMKGGDYQVIVQSDPDGCEVYVDGRLATSSTPARINISSKSVNKPIIFQFKKDGYESKSYTLSYTKKELKNTPVVNATLKRTKPQVTVVNADPTAPRGEEQKTVSRDNPGQTTLESTVLRWFFDSDPRGARIYWRVISSVPAQVKNTNETYLMTTPYEETRGFNIQGLSYENSRDVTIEIKVTKRGFEDQVKRFNARQALDQQEISGFFELVPKEDYESRRDDRRDDRRSNDEDGHNGHSSNNTINITIANPVPQTNE